MNLAEFAEKYDLDNAWQQSIRRQLEKNRGMRFAYPWAELETVLGQRGGDPPSLVGYGSLLNAKSAARTVAGTPEKGHPPVVAFGGRRVYEYIIPQKVLDRYGEKAEPSEGAALNLRPTGSADDLFNGRLIPLDLNDLEGLRERERAYDLEPVIVVPWGQWDQTPQLAFALACPPVEFEGRAFVDPELKPYPPYHRLCLEGAAAVSPEFADLFLQSTYLGDGETLV